MGQAIGQVLALGVGVSLSPVAIVAVVLMLAAPKGLAKGLAFLTGWALSLAVVGTLTLLVADDLGAERNGVPADWVIAMKLVLGVLLLFIAVRQLRGRPRGDTEPAPPAWTEKVDTFSPPKAAGMAVLLAAVKPKNPLLTVGAAVAIAETGANTTTQLGALAVFVLVGTLGPGLPVAIALLAGDRAASILGGMRDWMVRENATIIAVLCLIIAAKLIGDAISGLPS